MDHKGDEYWRTVLLQMAHDACENGDLTTGELLATAAMRYFDEAERLPARGPKIRRLFDDRGHLSTSLKALNAALHLNLKALNAALRLLSRQRAQYR
jgi:hypothetical protein